MIKQFTNWLNARRAFKNTYRALHQMSNHELQDIGINRSMITRVALEAAYGDRL